MDNAKGSLIAKSGFDNEKDVCNKFMAWKSDKDAQNWLITMGYKIEEIESVTANILHGYKADVNLLVQIKLKALLDTQNIQVKLVTSPQGFNQVEGESLVLNGYSLFKNLIQFYEIF